MLTVATIFIEAHPGKKWKGKSNNKHANTPHVTHAKPLKFNTDTGSSMDSQVIMALLKKDMR